MTPRRSFYRKIVYAAVIVALLVPTGFLSLPAVTEDTGAPGGLRQTGGGMIDQVRERHGLNNARLGDVDPTSETIKLALLGLRGVAANILWSQANEYKKKEDWTKMIATVDTITLLQPYFEQVWWFQGWNIAYNVSVEWDDYRDRYYWVKQGIEYLLRGVRRNNDSPTLLYWTGWVISHKMGKSDERTQFRAIFRQDDEFHDEIFAQDQQLAHRDSWYVGKVYMRRAHDVLDRFPDRTFSGTARSIFYASPGLNNFYWPIALVTEGILSDEVRQRWALGETEWSGSRVTPDRVIPLGLRELALALEPHIKIQLNRREEFLERREAAWQQLAELAQTVGMTIEPNVWDLDRAMTDRQSDAQGIVQQYLGDVADQAQPILDEILLCEHRAHWIGQYRDVVNFEYWRTRTQAEQSPDAAAVRQRLVTARQAHKVDADLWTARDDYAKTLEHWRLILAAYPDLQADDLTAEDVFEIIVDYQTVLNQLEDSFPPAGYGLLSVNAVADWEALRTALVRHDADTEVAAPEEAATAGDGPLTVLWWQAMPESLRQTLIAAPRTGGLTLPDQLAVLTVLNEQLETADLTRQLLEAADDLPAALVRRARRGEGEELTLRDRRLLNRELVEAASAGLIEPADREHFVLRTLVFLHPQLAESKDLPVNPLIERIRRLTSPIDDEDDQPADDGPMSVVPGDPDVMSLSPND